MPGGCHPVRTQTGGVSELLPPVLTVEGNVSGLLVNIAHALSGEFSAAVYIPVYLASGDVDGCISFES